MLTQHPLDRPVTASVQHRVVDIHGYDTLRSAAARMAENQIGMLVVRRGTLAVGIVSERDVVRAAAEGADIDEMRVDEVMTEDLAGVRAEASLREAIEVMTTNGIRHLLVRGEGRVLGILSARDVLRALHAQM